ncbi:Vms1/Ankzf1 family peptidyl-tRNA hydrolase [Nocardia bhagyanarayanae]|uniref:Peptide subunit release factor 1 (ERF1) n=1 Tax=Nocardia bhagyanarayanae TaxID=1215925 RepID=A0A543EY33_9NOCA|nr:Vms1/Ankzf1 family peptidyl-tRNA hydrolase [Nocardia bhagyanarayanae]TQM26497.1 peptide subunit release factor 1 (eRF1) [Nocardia bhagyanarayanae]
MNIRQVAERNGPFATVCIDASHDTEDAAHQTELRWRSIHDQLAGDGASDRMLAALDAAIAETPPGEGRSGRLLIADDEAVLVDERLPDPPAREIVRVSPMPYLLPLIEKEAEQVPHVVAVVDRVGCDLRAVDEHGTAVGETVQGDEHPVHKVPGGGWAHLSMERRVEETVRRNIDEVAQEVSALADRVHADVVVLAGEVAARSALHNAMPKHGDIPEHGAEIVEIEAGGRAEGIDTEAFDSEVHQAVAHAAEQRRRAVLDRFAAERERPGGLAVAGLTATTEALRMANVDRLLIDESALGDRVVRVGSGPGQVDADGGGLVEETARACRADEALPVAALAVGASITPVGEDMTLPDGVGALLRHR